MEVGIGIHGEPGRRRLPVAPAREVAEMLVEPILKDLDFTGGDGVSPSSTAWAAPRCSSSTSCTARSPRILERAGVQVARTLVGNYMTSLDMAGCSVSLLKVDDELLRLWDAPINTAAFRWGV